VGLTETGFAAACAGSFTEVQTIAEIDTAHNAARNTVPDAFLVRAKPFMVASFNWNYYLVPIIALAT
jgi:hypothetical protein